ncbi:hypothetical protein CEXT_522691, partial [Caerostris extrusa]
MEENGLRNIGGFVPQGFQLSVVLLFGSLFGVYLNEEK